MEHILAAKTHAVDPSHSCGSGHETDYSNVNSGHHVNLVGSHSHETTTSSTSTDNHVGNNQHTSAVSIKSNHWHPPHSTGPYNPNQPSHPCAIGPESHGIPLYKGQASTNHPSTGMHHSSFAVKHRVNRPIIGRHDGHDNWQHSGSSGKSESTDTGQVHALSTTPHTDSIPTYDHNYMQRTDNHFQYQSQNGTTTTDWKWTTDNGTGTVGHIDSGHGAVDGKICTTHGDEDGHIDKICKEFHEKDSTDIDITL